MSLWQTLTWDIARAGGFTAFGLLTCSVAVGLALTLHLQSARWPRIINSELHNFLTLLALLFTGLHILAIWVDPFTKFGWNEVFLPFVSHYRPVWMALGIVAFYIGIAISISTWLRPHIGYAWWRRLHVLTLLLYALVLVHGIATGSDTRSWWGAAIYALSAIVIGTLLWMRLVKPANAQSRAHPVAAVAMVGVLVIGTVWAVRGPFQPGWNAIANNGNSSGSAPMAHAASQQTAFPSSFTADQQAQLTRMASDGNGSATLQLDLSIAKGPPGQVQVILQRPSEREEGRHMTITSSRVTLMARTGQQLYVGPLTTIDGEKRWRMTALLTGIGTQNASELQIQMDVHVDAAGRAAGTLSANPAASGVAPSSLVAS